MKAINAPYKNRVILIFRAINEQQKTEQHLCGAIPVALVNYQPFYQKPLF